VLLAVTTGLRRSELFALKWKDVDYQTKQIYVTRSIVQNVVVSARRKARRNLFRAHDDLSRLRANGMARRRINRRRAGCSQVR